MSCHEVTRSDIGGDRGLEQLKGSDESRCQLSGSQPLELRLKWSLEDELIVSALSTQPTIRQTEQKININQLEFCNDKLVLVLELELGCREQRQ